MNTVFTLKETIISDCYNHVYLGQEVNMINDLAPELSTWKLDACGVFQSIEGVVKRTKNI